jgi:hypothetical protein
VFEGANLMENPNMKYEQFLKMFGTDEDFRKYKEQQEKLKELIKEIPTVKIEDVMRLNDERTI